MATPEERFVLACHELGWGDAEAGLWFFGIEEQHDWPAGSEARIEHHYAHGAYFRNEEINRRTQDPDEKELVNRSKIEWCQAKIAAPLSKRGMDVPACKAQLWRTGSSIAHLNLFPLGKPQAVLPLPERYLDLFGFGSTSSERLRYHGEVRRHRFPRVREAVASLKPQAIVCMSTTHRADFLEALELEECSFKPSGRDLDVNRDAKVILTRHWANGFPDELALRITAELFGLRVGLP